MKFFDRQREIDKLREIRERSRESSAFTVMTGRRRIGKTELVKQAFSDEPFVYLFVTRSAESDLCDGFKSRIEEVTGLSIPGRVAKFSELFRYLLQYAAERPVTVVLVQVGMFDELREIVLRDYEAFSGLALEGLFRARFAETHAYSRMGGWWDRKGENEIDLVCENEFEGTLDFYEVKRDAKRYVRETLETKVEAFFRKNPEKRERKISLRALSLSDLNERR